MRNSQSSMAKKECNIRASFPGNNEGAYQLQQFTAGLRENMVPGTAVAKLTAPSTEAALEMEKLLIMSKVNQ